MRRLAIWVTGAVLTSSAWGTDVSFNNSGAYSAAPSAPVATAKTHLQAKKADPNNPFLLIEVDFRRTGGVQEFRHLASSGSGALQPMPVTESGGKAESVAPTLSVARTTFGFSFSAYHDAQSAARLAFELPMNSLLSSDPAVPTGSEFGGVALALEGNYGSLLRARTWVFSLNSPKLKLHERHTETGLGLYLGLQDSLNRELGASVMFGPEFGFSSNGESEQYGAFWGGRAQIAGASGPLRWSLEALLRRLNGHEVAGVAEGGAGLLTWTPRLEYDLGEGIWVGMLAELPLFRPVGRETAFGNLSLPGVFGKSFGLSLRVATL